MALAITLFTDPACPFAFSAEPERLKLRWHYGEGLEWRTRMIVLTREPGEAEKLAAGAPGLQRKFGMPIEPSPYPRPSSSEPACRAVVAAQLHAPSARVVLLRALRVRRMAGGLIDDPMLIEAAPRTSASTPATSRAGWRARNRRRAPGRRRRGPLARPGGRALDHKLGGPREERRYTAPSYEFGDPAGDMIVAPGFQPFEAYEVAVANLARAGASAGPR